MTFEIHYSNGSIKYGETALDWRNLPDEGVQVVVVHGSPPQPWPDPMKTGFVGSLREDKTFYTGVDEYDPLNTGHKKYGKLIPDEKYWAIWNEAYGDC